MTMIIPEFTAEIGYIWCFQCIFGYIFSSYWPVGFEWTFITLASRSVIVTQNPSQSVCNGNIFHQPVGVQWQYMPLAGWF